MGVASPDPLWSALARSQSPTSSPEALRANLFAKTPEQPVYSEPWTPRGFTNTAEWPEVPEWASGPRVHGALQMAQGATEMLSGAGLLAVPEPTMLTKAGGIVAFVHGADVANAGWNSFFYGESQQTVSAQLARTLGPHFLPGGAAETLAFAVDVGPGLVTPLSYGPKINYSPTRTVREGIYEFAASSGKTYVGQSASIPTRINQHLSTGKLLHDDLWTVETVEVMGGKQAREVAEQLRINALGGVEHLENVRNPIGRDRRHLLPPKH